ncbi:MAG: anhydro-N-acetylmuramic acid kinase [Rhodospirillaceae bacterium]|nr:anhydro-N-acetylmuramic acid kinase [Rhodospirillaceae bacterium]MYB14436.1 anhydro-N-acetylmuramic acid kinase [Rhodospirillaceae bacterium]
MTLRTAIGMMSGTSLDGVDVALIRSDGAWRIEAGPARTYGYAEAQRATIRACLGREQASEAAVAVVTDAHLAALRAFLVAEDLRPGEVDLVGFHGQTVFHDPENGVTVQIGDARALAQAVGIPVVSDFRSADMRGGGQGAPLAPLYHAALSAGLEKPLAVLNLGGVANVTWIGAGRRGGTVKDTPLLAFDTGPANALLDDWMVRTTGAAFDPNGETAARGTADTDRVAAWLSHPHFAAEPPKSLDRNAFDAKVDDLGVADGAATLAAFCVQSVARAPDWMPERPRRWLVTGGGRRNGFLMDGLRRALAAPVEPVEAVGWDGDALEAQAFGWLALRVADGLPTSLPETTGVSAPTSGGLIDRPD